MNPAFRTKADAVAFVGFAGLILSLPILLDVIGLSGRQQLYSGVSANLGPISNIEYNVFEDHRDSDVLFLGSSGTDTAIIPSQIRSYFSAKLGRESVVKMLSMWIVGADLQYVMLKDYLDRHSTKLIVLELPSAHTESSYPHRTLTHFLRYGEFKDAFEPVSLPNKLSIYAGQAVGSLRDTVGLLRPNLIDESEKSDQALDSNLASLFGKKGYLNRPFQSASLVVSDQAKKDALMPETSARISYRKTGVDERYTTYFLRKIDDLAKSKGISILLMSFPRRFEYDETDVPEILPLAEIFGPRTKLVAIPCPLLFNGMARDQSNPFWLDDLHLNLNGATVFDSAILPSLYHEYEEAASR